MKRTICLLLVIVMVIGMLPLTAFAASKNYIEVVKEAPLRTKGDGGASVAMRCEEGVVLESLGTYFNWRKLSKWHKVKVPGYDDIYYIYDGNVKSHTYEATELTINGIVYKVCGCGEITAETATQEERKEANVVLSSVPLAIPFAFADGPLPIGDIAAAVITIVGVCVAHDYAIPAAEELAVMATEADFDKYFEDRAENTCSRYSFRRVVRFPGGLKYTDQYCMDAAEAFVYVSLIHGDVYTADEDSALMLAAMFGSAIMERDKASPKKDNTTYFFHYHVGTDRVNKSHIFFGLNDLNQGPI